MAQETHDHQQFNALLAAWLRDPSSAADVDAAQLAPLLEKYPFSQPLRYLCAALAVNGEQEKELRAAALYAPQRRVLRSVMKREVKATTGIHPEPSHKPAERPEPAAETASAEAASTDSFRPVSAASEPPESQQPTPETASPESTGVAKYDDDKMPYTFLWWLSKTRSEHAETYRPYASSAVPQIAPEQKKKPEAVLSRQYIENIFHLKNEVEAAPDTRTVPFEVKTKEDKIIDKFIREDPAIKPLRADKIDTENKARGSSEDSYELVSETLAQIYLDQMLYTKAADVYRKLRLKFPEKSAYFADQIRQIERKL